MSGDLLFRAFPVGFLRKSGQCSGGFMSRLDHELSWAEDGYCGASGSFPECVKRNGSDGLQKRILVIEEDLDVSKITKDILRRNGYDVVTSSSGSDILILCSPNGYSPAVVLIDSSYFDQCNSGLLRKIYSVNPSLKVIVTSIYNHDWDTMTMYVDGAAGYLKKPYRMADLLRIIDRVEVVQ